MLIIRIGQKLIPFLMAVVVLMLIVMLQFGFIFLCIALLPSIAAYFLEEDPERPAFRTIFACNLAATIPTARPMFISGLRFKYFDVTQTLLDPKVWMFIYLGAALGWAMIYFGYSIGMIFLTIKHRINVGMLERAQAKLLEEWGAIISTKPENQAQENQGIS